MEEKINEDISEKIQRTAPEPVRVVTPDIAQKEESVAKSVAQVPTSKDDLEARKQKVIDFLKKKKDWIYYLILAFIVFINVYIRTRNVSKLKDITTGTWTLGPDLDPFLFLRWAQYIAEHGKLFVMDTMRYVPLADICSGSSCEAVNTNLEMVLVPYLIVILHKFLNFFSDVTVTYSALIFPAVMSMFTAVAFFFFTRKIFYKEKKNIRNIIALIATAFFVLVPSLLPRTIAGIPEKESVGFFFMFMAFYFILEAFTSKKFKNALIFGSLAGAMTTFMALTWGGVIFIFITIAIAFLLAFIFSTDGR